MRILHVIGSMEVGGAQAILCGLAEEAVSRGHTCEVISVRSQNGYTERLGQAGIAVHSLGFDAPLRLRSLPALRRARRRLVGVAAAFEPDVIHAHLLGAALVLMNQQRRLGAPIVQTLHGTPPWYRPRRFSQRMQLAVSRRFARHAAMFSVAISRDVQAESCAALGLAAGRAPVVMNFVESLPEGITPAAASERLFPRGGLRIGLVSRLVVGAKGLDVAAAALAELSEARLIVLGDGPQRSEFERLCTEHGVRERVEMRGLRGDVYAQLREMDLLWVPSRWEGFGLVAAEAAMMGLPVVASAVGGLAEVVRDGETGRLVPVGDAHALAAATRELAADPVTYRRFAENALADAKVRFSRARAGTEYLTLYAQAINAP